VRFEAEQVAQLVRLLQECLERSQRGGGRQWFTLTWSQESLKRARITEKVNIPQYESAAAPNYVRGDVLHVMPTEYSCNIDFAGLRAGAWMLEEIQEVQKRVRRFMEVIVPNRRNKQDLVQFVADTDLESRESDEHQRLGQMGLILASQVWPADDFSDWETEDE